MSVYIECCKCGVAFWLTEYMNARRREDYQSFYCPNGHPQSYIKPEKTEDQKEIERLERVRQRDSYAYQASLDREEDWKKAARVCPICEERVTTAQFIETIRAKVAQHLRDEHGAKARLRAITERATA